MNPAEEIPVFTNCRVEPCSLGMNQGATSRTPPATIVLTAWVLVNRFRGPMASCVGSSGMTRLLFQQRSPGRTAGEPHPGPRRPEGHASRNYFNSPPAVTTHSVLNAQTMFNAKPRAPVRQPLVLLPTLLRIRSPPKCPAQVGARHPRPAWQPTGPRSAECRDGPRWGHCQHRGWAGGGSVSQLGPMNPGGLISRLDH